MKLNEKIITLRKQKGMSQENLAEEINVSRQAISRWENDEVMPDSINILEMSKLFDVSTDYLLNDDYDSDDDLPKVKVVKKDNKILQANLTRIAIIAQAALLNVAIQPIIITESSKYSWIVNLIKILFLALASIWMTKNLKYEKNPVQYKKNTKIELSYTIIQAIVAVAGYYTKRYLLTSLVLLVICLFYIFVINPKYMNRKLVR